MPTIHREAGFVFSFFSDEHLPAHVHVTGHGAAMKILLGGGKVPPSIHSSRGMKEADARKAFRITENNRDAFLKKWREIHG